MTARVGLVGCGDISHAYVENARAFDSYAIVACASRTAARAETFAAEHALAAATVDELVADPAIDVVLNLTPAEAHASVTRAALAAGKHVYSEKPLAATVAEAEELVAEAEQRGVRLACAPDIFLGGAYRAARALLDDGAIGEPLSVSAAMLVGGFPVTTPTHVAAVLELESGVTADLVTSFDAPGQYVCDLEIHGTAGVLSLPDPNAFGGSVRVKRGGGDWQALAYESGGPREARGVGIDDLVAAIEADRPHRASAGLALHVLDVATTILRAADERRTIDVTAR